jgi:hypothetical protein
MNEVFPCPCVNNILIKARLSRSGSTELAEVFALPMFALPTMWTAPQIRPVGRASRRAEAAASPTGAIPNPIMPPPGYRRSEAGPRL